ncbi:hypothetical protein F5887DRAFT_991231 [Amanita rubescens]|nr:hypothetical protein F5887DRAFT_991231 [Amanita rubescens]
MLFIYAWLFFLFGTSVVALPAGESSSRSSRRNKNNVVISYGSTDQSSTPPPLISRPQTALSGHRKIYPVPDGRNGLWTAKLLRSQRFAGYLLHYDGGAYILVRVDANFAIIRRRVLETRADKAHLVGTWVRVPTVNSPADDRFKELVIAIYTDEHSDHPVPTLVAQIIPSPFSELDIMPDPPEHNVLLPMDGYWVATEMTRDTSDHAWKKILQIDGAFTLGTPQELARLVGDYVRAPYEGIHFQIQVRYTKLSIRHDATQPEGISLTTSYMPQPGINIP